MEIKNAELDAPVAGEEICIGHFDSERGISESNIRCTMYTYDVYRIATIERMGGEVVGDIEVCLILDKVLNNQILLGSITDAIDIINIIEGRSNGEN